MTSPIAFIQTYDRDQNPEPVCSQTEQATCGWDHREVAAEPLRFYLARPTWLRPSLGSPAAAGGRGWPVGGKRSAEFNRPSPRKQPKAAIHTGTRPERTHVAGQLVDRSVLGHVVLFIWIVLQSHKSGLSRSPPIVDGSPIPGADVCWLP